MAGLHADRSCTVSRTTGRWVSSNHTVNDPFHQRGALYARQFIRYFLLLFAYTPDMGPVLISAQQRVVVPTRANIDHGIDENGGADGLDLVLVDVDTARLRNNSLSAKGMICLRSVGKNGRQGITFCRIEIDSAVRRRRVINNPTGLRGADGCKTA